MVAPLDTLRQQVRQRLRQSRTFAMVAHLAPAATFRRSVIHGLSIEVSSTCTLGCPFCPVGNRVVTAGLMALDDFRTIVNRLPATVRHVSFCNRGEPTLNPHLATMVSEVHGKELGTTVHTNGMLLDRHVDGLVRSGLDTLVVAVDGATQVVHERYRVGADLARIQANLRQLLAARQATADGFPRQVILQCIISRHNEHQLDEVRQMARDLGVGTIHFKTLAENLGGRQLRDEQFHQGFVAQDARYRRHHDYTVCPAVSEPVVLFNGDVSVCCTDFLGEHVVGNLLQDPGVFASTTYDRVRKRMLLRQLDICQACPITGDTLYSAE